MTTAGDNSASDVKPAPVPSEKATKPAETPVTSLTPSALLQPCPSQAHNQTPKLYRMNPARYAPPGHGRRRFSGVNCQCSHDCDRRRHSASDVKPAMHFSGRAGNTPVTSYLPLVPRPAPAPPPNRPVFSPGWTCQYSHDDKLPTMPVRRQSGSGIVRRRSKTSLLPVPVQLRQMPCCRVPPVADPEPASHG